MKIFYSKTEKEMYSDAELVLAFWQLDKLIGYVKLYGEFYNLYYDKKLTQPVQDNIIKLLSSICKYSDRAGYKVIQTDSNSSKAICECTFDGKEFPALYIISNQNNIYNPVECIECLKSKKKIYSQIYKEITEEEMNTMIRELQTDDVDKEFFNHVNMVDTSV